MTKLLDELMGQARDLPEQSQEWLADLLRWEIDQVSDQDAEANARAFERFVQESKARSPEAWRFSREEIYRERMERYRPRLP